jgi:hypothetical protein
MTKSDPKVCRGGIWRVLPENFTDPEAGQEVFDLIGGPPSRGIPQFRIPISGLIPTFLDKASRARLRQRRKNGALAKLLVKGILVAPLPNDQEVRFNSLAVDF